LAVLGLNRVPKWIIAFILLAVVIGMISVATRLTDTPAKSIAGAIIYSQNVSQIEKGREVIATDQSDQPVSSSNTVYLAPPLAATPNMMTPYPYKTLIPNSIR
jgi:phosphate/sulfate permease